MKHKTRLGTVIEISKMSDTHLINTIKMIQRKANDGILIRHGSGDAMTGHDMYYDEDRIFGEAALKAMNYQYYFDELANRGLTIDASQTANR